MYMYIILYMYLSEQFSLLNLQFSLKVLSDFLFVHSLVFFLLCHDQLLLEIRHFFSKSIFILTETDILLVKTLRKLNGK